MKNFILTEIMKKLKNKLKTGKIDTVQLQNILGIISSKSRLKAEG